MDLQITAFPARNGESLLIECYGKEKTNILTMCYYGCKNSIFSI